MGQFAGARADTGRTSIGRIIQQLADRIRKLELYYTFRDTPARDASGDDTNVGVVRNDRQGVVLAGPEGHTWRVGVDEHGRLVAEDGAGARTVLAASNRDGGMV